MSSTSLLRRSHNGYVVHLFLYVTVQQQSFLYTPTSWQNLFHNSLFSSSDYLMPNLLSFKCQVKLILTFPFFLFTVPQVLAGFIKYLRYLLSIVCSSWVPVHFEMFLLLILGAVGQHLLWTTIYLPYNIYIVCLMKSCSAMSISSYEPKIARLYCYAISSLWWGIETLN